MLVVLACLLMGAIHLCVGFKCARSGAHRLLVATLSFLGVITLSGVILGTLGILYGQIWCLVVCGMSVGMLAVALRAGDPSPPPQEAKKTSSHDLSVLRFWKGLLPRLKLSYPGHTVVLAGAALALIVLVTVIKVSLSEPANVDDLAYHYPKLFHLISNRSFEPAGLELVDSYPQNGELLAAFAYHVLASSRLVDGVQLLCVPMYCASIWILARSLKVSENLCTFCALVGCFVPAVWSVIPTMHVDFYAASLLLAAVGLLFSRGVPNNSARLILLGIALGLLAGTKYVALPWVLVLVVAVFLTERKPQSISDMLLFVLPLVLLGGERYAANILSEGNPLAPYSIPGLGIDTTNHARSLEDLWEERMTVGLSHLQKITRSWFSLSAIAQTNHEHWFGGLGAMWPLVFVCSLISIIIAAKKRDVLVLKLATVACALFFVTPANFTARFVLFLPAIGAALTGYLLQQFETNRRDSAKVILQSLLFVAIVQCCRQSLALYVAEAGPRRGATLSDSCANMGVPIGLARLMRSPERQVFQSHSNLVVMMGDEPTERRISYACIWELASPIVPRFKDLRQQSEVIQSLPAEGALVMVSSGSRVELSQPPFISERIYDRDGLQLFRVSHQPGAAQTLR